MFSKPFYNLCVMKLTRKYSIFLGILLVGFVVVTALSPEPADWSPSYSRYDDIPLGTSALAEVLPEVLPQQQVIFQKSPIFDTLAHLPQHTSYVNITHELVLPEPYLSRLLKYVAQGNTAFIAAEDFGQLGDTLQFRLLLAGNENVIENMNPQDSTPPLHVNFTHPTLKSKQDFLMPEKAIPYYFDTSINPKNTYTGLAYAQQDTVLYHFIKINFGKGVFYLHCNPRVFSNYFILEKNTQKYPFKVLSYLPLQTTYWEEKQVFFNSSGKSRISRKSRHHDFSENDDSVFRFLLSQPSLKAAYFLTLLGILLFVIFQGRRRQRIIPIVTPPSNTSLVFVQTVGQLYFNEGNHLDIARKKITYWQAFLRRKLYISYNDLGEECKKELTQKTALSSEAIEELCRYVVYVQNAKQINAKELHYLNTLIENFYRQL